MGAFIGPPQRDVIEKILRGHLSGADHRFASVPAGGLGQSAAARAPPADSVDPSGYDSGSTNGSDNEPAELTYVDMDMFLATF